MAEGGEERGVADEAVAVAEAEVVVAVEEAAADVASKPEENFVSYR